MKLAGSNGTTTPSSSAASSAHPPPPPPPLSSSLPEPEYKGNHHDTADLVDVASHSYSSDEHSSTSNHNHHPHHYDDLNLLPLSSSLSSSAHGGISGGGAGAGGESTLETVVSEMSTSGSEDDLMMNDTEQSSLVSLDTHGKQQQQQHQRRKQQQQQQHHHHSRRQPYVPLPAQEASAVMAARPESRGASSTTAAATTTSSRSSRDRRYTSLSPPVLELMNLQQEEVNDNTTSHVSRSHPPSRSISPSSSLSVPAMEGNHRHHPHQPLHTRNTTSPNQPEHISGDNQDTPPEDTNDADGGDSNLHHHDHPPSLNDCSQSSSFDGSDSEFWGEEEEAGLRRYHITTDIPLPVEFTHNNHYQYYHPRTILHAIQHVWQAFMELRIQARQRQAARLLTMPSEHDVVYNVRACLLTWCCDATDRGIGLVIVCVLAWLLIGWVAAPSSHLPSWWWWMGMLLFLVRVTARRVVEAVCHTAKRRRLHQRRQRQRADSSGSVGSTSGMVSLSSRAQQRARYFPATEVVGSTHHIEAMALGRPEVYSDAMTPERPTTTRPS